MRFKMSRQGDFPLQAAHLIPSCHKLDDYFHVKLANSSEQNCMKHPLLASKTMQHNNYRPKIIVLPGTHQHDVSRVQYTVIQGRDVPAEQQRT